MKNLFRLVYVNIKRMIKDPGKMTFMFIMPLAVILFINFINTSGDNSQNISDETVAYNIEDSGEVWKTVFIDLEEDENTFINDKEAALELLEGGHVSAVYNIPSDFSDSLKEYKKPKIKSYKIQEGNTTIPVEIGIDEAINKWIEEEYLLQNGIIKSKNELNPPNIKTTLIKDGKPIDGDVNLATIMMIYFIILGASFIGPELIELKERNIISRAITTPNTSFTILGSLAISFLILQVGINMIILFAGKLLLGYQIFHLNIIFINIVLASLFSITLSLAITRLFKNAGVVGTITAIVSIVTMILSGLAQEAMYQETSKIIINLGKFTPQYWIMDSLEKSVLFPNTFIVLLIIMALFTAGSYRLKDF